MENYDISKFYTVVEEYRADYMQHFHMNDIYVVHEDDIERFLQSVWMGDFSSKGGVVETVHQPSDYVRYHVRRPRRIMEVISIGS